MEKIPTLETGSEKVGQFLEKNKAEMAASPSMPASRAHDTQKAAKLQAEVDTILAQKDSVQAPAPIQQSSAPKPRYAYSSRISRWLNDKLMGRPPEVTERVAREKALANGQKKSSGLGRFFRRGATAALLNIAAVSPSGEKTTSPEFSKAPTPVESAAPVSAAAPRMENIETLPKTITPTPSISMRSPEDQAEHEAELKMVITPNNTRATPEDVENVIKERKDYFEKAGIEDPRTI